MKKSVMEKWVKALRSGEYKQGRSNLKNIKNEFCCLGVLCDISGVHEWENEKSSIVYNYDAETAGLPGKVMEWSGIRETLGHFRNSDIDPLFRLNDSSKFSFDEIADIIEKNYKSL